MLDYGWLCWAHAQGNYEATLIFIIVPMCDFSILPPSHSISIVFGKCRNGSASIMQQSRILFQCRAFSELKLSQRDVGRTTTPQSENRTTGGVTAQTVKEKDMKSENRHQHLSVSNFTRCIALL